MGEVTVAPSTVLTVSEFDPNLNPDLEGKSRGAEVWIP